MTLTSYAQNFEDVILWRALKHIERGFYIDIGAQDPVTASVSLAFYENGWRGVHVEPTTHYAGKLRQARPGEEVIQAAVAMQTKPLIFYEVPDTGLSTGSRAIAARHRKQGYCVREVSVSCVSLASILERYRDRDIHWLKIDAEGMERQVIKSWFPSKVRPWIVIVESTEPNSPKPNFAGWESLIIKLGYEFAYFDGLNRLYVSRSHRELKKSFEAGPNIFDDFVLSETVPFSAKLSTTIGDLRRQLDERSEETAQITQTAEKLKHTNSLLNADIFDLKAALFVHNNLLASRDHQIATLDTEIGNLRQAGWREATLSQRASEKAAAQQQEITTLEERLAGIYHSTSWRVTEPLRFISHWAKVLSRGTWVWIKLQWRTVGSHRVAAGSFGGSAKQRLFSMHVGRPSPDGSADIIWENATTNTNSASQPRIGPSPEPQSVRVAYNRLMQARQTLTRRPPANWPNDGERPRLAYVSPLPPERSGIADYSAELLPELARHYAIDVVTDQSEVSDSWINENCPIRDTVWFERHAHFYDGIVYHIGNSPFHRHMLDLVKRNPGVIVLHDFYLSGLIAGIEIENGRTDFWSKALYQSHGYNALRERHQVADVAATVWKYPANLPALQSAVGVIVHSRFAQQLARRFYGENFANDWAIIPHLRGLPDIGGREQARYELGFGDKDFVVCSFGMMGESKLNLRTLEAWLASRLARDATFHLVFVGQGETGPYGEVVRRLIDSSGFGRRIRISGFASRDLYHQYLLAADAAVQLRTLSRGETSGAVLDCMGGAVPTIVNAHGSLAELPDECVVMIPDDFTNAELIGAIEALRGDPARRVTLGQNARQFVKEQLSPRAAANRYHEAIKKFAEAAPTVLDPKALAAEVVRITTAAPDESAWLQHARKLAKAAPSKLSGRQLLVDVSAVARVDLKTGIQRVVKAQLLALLKCPPTGFRVEPVRLCNSDSQWRYRYARNYMAKLLSLPESILEDDPVEVAEGDIFYAPDYFTDGVIEASASGIYADWSAQGVEINFLVHDILPLTMPKYFPVYSEKMHENWLRAIAESSDRLICVSRTVAQETHGWLKLHEPEVLPHLEIAVSHHGADINAFDPSKGLPPDAGPVLHRLSSCPSFLMVGTIEPRKGHLQVLTAFERLWAQGIDINLVIAGAEGWKSVAPELRRNISQIVEKLRSHPKLGTRLFWLEDISDEFLDKVYTASACLIAASQNEGFGLPLIEAAQHGVPILARDTSVFREVAGQYAGYFSGDDAESLANTVKDWLGLYLENRHSKSDDMPWLTWEQSTDRLKLILLGEDIFALRDSSRRIRAKLRAQ